MIWVEAFWVRHRDLGLAALSRIADAGCRVAGAAWVGLFVLGARVDEARERRARRGRHRA